MIYAFEIGETASRRRARMKAVRPAGSTTYIHHIYDTVLVGAVSSQVSRATDMLHAA